MNAKTCSHATLRVKPSDVELLRRKPGNQEAYMRIFRACDSWLRRFGSGLSREERADIIHQSLCDLIDALKPNSKIPLGEVPMRLQKSLNRLRARAWREAAKNVEYQISDEIREALDRCLETDPEAQLDDRQTREQRAQRLFDVLFLLGKYIRLAVEMLSPRDYSILHSLYRLGELGLAAPTEPPEPLSGSTLKVAMWRARHRFLHELESLLDAAHKALSEDRQQVEDALRLVRSPELERWLRQ